jgi:hypothetical protein
MIAKIVERAISIHAAMSKHPIHADTRANLSRYLDVLLAGGEIDPNRLTVQALAYLRSWDLKAARNV